MSYNRASAIVWLLRREASFTSADLAEVLGVSRRTANRLLVQLADDGLVVDVAVAQTRTTQRVVYQSAIGFRGGAPRAGHRRMTEARASYVRADRGFGERVVANRDSVEARVRAGAPFWLVLSDLASFLDGWSSAADARLAMCAHYDEHRGSQASAAVATIDEVARLIHSEET